MLNDEGQHCQFALTNSLLLATGPKECKNSMMGSDYVGDISITVSGKACQKWNLKSPHHHQQKNFPDSSIMEAGNKCRNPDNWSEGPWCYTTDVNVRWELCDIPMCKGINR